ncbi:hypothetical protein [Allosphingosinicella sp.]|jgi:hypothetical protein|uniref:hypothetical protein n=1 Tax=Allosphingosinicella sp. TaxID=2823234 RepID=UPI002EEE8037
MSIGRKILIFAAAVAGIGLANATPANAQATRTWVSGVGDDVNPCSRTAPCKTFAGAISKTAAGGEINCLDPGGYGAVSINKSMVISCPYTEGGALAGGNGISVNDSLAAAPGTAVVIIRGLDIFGVNPPSNGIRFTSGAALHVEDTVIRRFNATNSQGISFQPAGAAELYVTNTTISQNGNAATGGGILIQPTGAGGSAKVVLRDVRVFNNDNTGMRVDSSGNTNATGISVAIENSQFSGNGTGIAAVAVGTNPIVIMLADSTVANNSGTGILGNGTGVTMRVGNTTITGNATGVNAAGSSTINTYGDNRNIGNPTVGAANNGTFTGIPIAKQ